jgi:uncharacterized protein YhaN
MTTAEALAIAAQAKPKHRQPLDKLAGTTVAQLSAETDALNKRFDGMGGTAADIQKQLDRARAGVALFADVMKINLMETMQ